MRDEHWQDEWPTINEPIRGLWMEAALVHMANARAVRDFEDFNRQLYPPPPELRERSVDDGYTNSGGPR